MSHVDSVHLDVVHVDAILTHAEANLSSPMEIALAMAQLRVLSSADGAPDEGMRGISDAARETMLGEHLCPRVMAVAAGALSTNSPEAAAHAAALVRNLSISVRGAQRVADSPIPAALAIRLRSGGPDATVALSLAAVLRLSQYHETHADLREAGFPGALPKGTAFAELLCREDKVGAARWFPEMIVLAQTAFLDGRLGGAQPDGKGFSLDDLMVDRLVGMLAARLECRSSAEVVEQFGFYYPPGLIVEGLSSLARLPGPRRRLGAESSSAISLLLRILSEPCGSHKQTDELRGWPVARKMSISALVALAANHDVTQRILKARGESIIRQASVEDPHLLCAATTALHSLGVESLIGLQDPSLPNFEEQSFAQGQKVMDAPSFMIPFHQQLRTSRL